MCMSPRIRVSARGSALPVAIAVVTLVVVITTAILEISVFGSLAAQAQRAGVAALHLADTGLRAYERGAITASGSTTLGSNSGDGLVSAEQLLVLPDSTVVMLVHSRGTSPAGAQPTGRRTLQVLVLVDSNGARRRVRGSLAEEF